MRVGVIGNTVLTSKGLDLLISQGHTVSYVFGLPAHQQDIKVNYQDLAPYCTQQSIDFYQSNDFSKVYHYDIDLVIALGDSRIIPVKNFNCPLIGNHGAALPNIKGGASLVWARLLNSGSWGVSLMTLGEKVDSGEILGVTHFTYPTNMSMATFVSLCDDITIELLDQFLHYPREGTIQQNSKTMITVGKHIDSQVGTTIARLATLHNLSIYLPPRTPDDSILKDCWDEEFKENFKRANCSPYPDYKRCY